MVLNRMMTPIAGALMLLGGVGMSAHAAYTLVLPVAVVVQDEALSLGTYQLGASFSRYITFTNSTTAAFVPTIEAPAIFTIDAGSCGYGALAVGRSCQFKVSGLVNSATVAGTVAVTGGNQQRNYKLTAKGVSVLKGVVIEPAIVDMGTTSVNKPALSKFTLINLTEAPIAASSVKAPAGVVLSGCDEVLPGKSCQVSATWKPLAAVALNGTLSFTSAEGTYAIGALTGNSQRGELVWDTSKIDLKGEIGKATAPLSVSLVNQGNGDLGLTSFVGSDASYVINSSQCPAVLAPGKACTITIVATPSKAGGVAGVIRATTSNSIASTSLVQVNVEGTAPVPLTKFAQLELSSSTLTSNPTLTATATLTIKNPSQSVVNVQGYSVNNDKIKLLNTANCTGSLAAGAQCTMNVQYKGDVGYQGSALITANTDGSPAAVVAPVQLWHQVPKLRASNALLDYGTLIQGTGKTLFLEITNVGDFTSNSVVPTLTGKGGLTVSGCGSTLTPRSSCTLTISHPATVVGEDTGTLSVSGGLTPLSVNYLAKVVAPTPVSNFSTTGFTCGEQWVGNVATCNMTLTNKGTTSATVSGVNTTSAGFTTTTNCGTVGAGASCLVSVKGASNVAGVLSVPVGYSVNGTAYKQAASINFKPYIVDLLPNLGKAVVGSAKTGNLTFKNQAGAQLTGITWSYSANYTPISSTCTNVLNAGASCTTTVRYQSNVEGPIKGTATLQSAVYNNTYNFEALVKANAVSVSTPQGTTTEILGFSKSGVVRRLTNDNDESVTLTIPFVSNVSPWNMVWTRATNTSVNFFNRGPLTNGVPDTNQLTSLVGRQGVVTSTQVCATGLVLLPKASCDIVEMPEFYDATYGTNLAIARTVVAKPVIGTSLGPVSWNSTFNLKYVSATLVSQQEKLEAAGMPSTFTFRVDNPASAEVGGVAVAYGTILSNSCKTAANTVALNAVPAKASCLFEASVSGPTAYITANLPQTIGTTLIMNNRNVYSGKDNAVALATFNLTSQVGKFAGQWATSPFKATTANVSVSSIQKYVNSGSLPQKLMKDAYLVPGTTTSGVFTLGAATTCKAGLVLKPADSCDVEMVVAKPTPGQAAASAELAVDYGSQSGVAKATVKSGAIPYEFMFVEESIVSASGPYAKCTTAFVMLKDGRMICEKWRETPLRTDVAYNNLPMGVHEIMVSSPVAFADWTSPVSVGSAQTDNFAKYYPTTGSGMRTGTTANYFTVVGAQDYRSKAVRLDVVDNLLTYTFINSTKQGPASTSGNSMVYPTYYTNLVNTFDTNTRTFGTLKELMPRRNASLIYDESTAVLRDKNGGQWTLVVGETLRTDVAGQPYVRNGRLTATYTDKAGVVKSSTALDATLMANYAITMQRAAVDKATGKLYWVAPAKANRAQRIVYTLDPSGVSSTINLPASTETAYGLEPGLASVAVTDNVDENQDVSAVAVRDGYLVYVPYSTSSVAMPVYAINLNTATPKVAVVAYTKAVPSKGIGSTFYHLAEAYDGNLYFGNGRMFKWADIKARVQ